MSAELAVNDECQQSWTEATLSSSPTSSYEDVNERSGEGPSDLSSFILINEGNSFEVPGGSAQMQARPGLQGSTIFNHGNPGLSSADVLEPAKSSAVKVNSSPGSVERFKSSSEYPKPIETASSSAIKANSSGKLASSPKKATSPGNVLSSSSGESSKIFRECHKPQESFKVRAPPMPAFKMQAMEPQVSQREAVQAVNANKEYKLKVAKLMGILDKKTADAVEQQSKLHVLSEERRKHISDLQSKDAVIADLKQKMLLKADQSQGNDSYEFSEKVKRLEKANAKMSAENIELKQKVDRLGLENKTLFERSTVLLSQIQDSETKRAVEACERQVLEGKIDHLIEEMTKMRRELHDHKGMGFQAATHGGPQDLQQKLDKGAGVRPSNRRDLYLPRRDQAAPTENGDVTREGIVGNGVRSGRPIRQDSNERCAPHELKPTNRDIGSQGFQHNTRKPPHHHPRSLDDTPDQFPGSVGGSNTANPGNRGVATRGETIIETECPMCGKKLSGVESLIAIHVERCIQLSEVSDSSRQEIQQT